MSTISERVEELRLQYIGKTISYRGESRTGRVTEIEGTVTDVAFAGCSISNDRGEWLGIKFRIRNGRRHIWTSAMPDEHVPESVAVAAPKCDCPCHTGGAKHMMACECERDSFKTS